MIVATTDHPARRSLRDPRRQTIHLLAAGIALLALLNILPMVVALHAPVSDRPANLLGGALLETWALGIVLIAVLHLVYLLYVLQLPDYSCVRVVSLFLLAVSTLYAVVLALRLLASEGNGLMRWLGLDSNVFSSSQEALWCFLMVLISGSLSYLAGRAASRLAAT